MRYLFGILISLLTLSGVHASLPADETTPLTRKETSINPTELINVIQEVSPIQNSPSAIHMSETGPSKAERVGNCFGRFMACWNKENPEDEDPIHTHNVFNFPKGKGTKALFVGGTASIFATLSAFCSGACCMICGYGRCCFNSDLFCIKLIGATGCCDFTCCGYVCGNGGCVKAGCVSFMTAGGACCLASCCFISIGLCHSTGSCDYYCDKVGMPNCAKGFQAGYTGKK